MLRSAHVAPPYNLRGGTGKRRLRRWNILERLSMAVHGSARRRTALDQELLEGTIQQVFFPPACYATQVSAKHRQGPSLSLSVSVGAVAVRGALLFQDIGGLSLRCLTRDGRQSRALCPRCF